MLNVGIVGYGYMGKIRRRVIEKNSRLRLNGICEIDKDVRDRITDCQTFDSFEKLLQENIDVIFVCTPNRYSPEICMESLKRKKHVFCEKPPGRSVDEIKNIMRFENKDVKLMFGFNHRFHPSIVKTRSILDSGRFGKILCLRGIYGKSGGAHFPESWKNNKEISGGGILLDQGIHMLDLFRYFCEDFEHVKCFIDNSFWKFNVEENAYVILQNKKGQIAFLHSSSTHWKHIFKLDIILERGYLNIEGFLSKTRSYGQEKLIVGKRSVENKTDAIGNPPEEITYFDNDLSWELEVEMFTTAIEQNLDIKTGNSSDALAVMSIIGKAYEDAHFNL